MPDPLDKVMQLVGRAMDAELEEIARDVGKRAQALAPIGAPPDDEHPGRLRASMRIERLPRRYGGWAVSFNTRYAAIQHEMPSTRSRPGTWLHPHGGRRKYLDIAVKEATATFERRLGRKVQHTIRENW